MFKDVSVDNSLGDRKIKVGIVGLGLVANSHIEGYENNPKVELLAVCDTDEERAKNIARRHNIPLVFGSFISMLESDIDAVSITTPTYLHAEMTMLALQYGKHVNCEKPFCINVGEGQKVINEAKARNLVLAVDESYIFTSSFLKARKLIEQDLIGEPMQMRQRLGPMVRKLTDQSEMVLPNNRDWRVDGDKSGGGDYPWLFDISVHFFAIAEHLMLGETIQEVFSVSSSEMPLNSKMKLTDDPYTLSSNDIPLITWKYRTPYKQGVWMRAEPLNGKYDFMQGFSVSIFGSKGMLEILGEGGANLLHDGKQVQMILYKNGFEPESFTFEENGDSRWQSDVNYYNQAHCNQIEDFIEAIIFGREPVYGGRDGLRAVNVALASIVSATNNIPVKLEDV
mgnify:FL=1